MHKGYKHKICHNPVVIGNVAKAVSKKTVQDMKKMLVPFDEAFPGKRVNDFVYPHVDKSITAFIGIRKPKIWTKGMVVYTGVDITAHDIFSKIVDSGMKIDSVDSMMESLQTYVSQLGEFKIGNVLEVEKDDTSSFRLKKFADRIQISGSSKIP